MHPSSDMSLFEVVDQLPHLCAQYAHQDFSTKEAWSQHDVLHYDNRIPMLRQNNNVPYGQAVIAMILSIPQNRSPGTMGTCSPLEMNMD